MTAHADARLDAQGLAALLRPRILTLVLVETAAGFLLAEPDTMAVLPWLLLGTGLVAAAGCALNHWIERAADARMPRTATRPLVTGALSPAQVLGGGLGCVVLGLVLLGWQAGLLCAAIQAGAAAIYLGIYTPLKSKTSTNTWVGAIPGALPVLSGAAAAHGTLPRLPVIVFLLIVLWQLPHFFAIASMYREQYRSGGMRMLSDQDPEDALLRWQMPLMVMSVVLVSVLPVALGATHALYAGAALTLGAMFLWSAFRFRSSPEPSRARSVVLASVAYLPLLLGALVVDVACVGGEGPGDDATRDLPVFGEVPAFELINQDGVPFSRSEMDGEVWVVDFMFTRCAGICVPMSRRMVDFQEEGLPARYLSVSVDPSYDGPPVLRSYREKWDGDPETWTLATGTQEAVESLANDGFKLPAATRGDTGSDPAPMEGMPGMFHSGRFAVVDPSGRVRGYYDHSDELEMKRLRKDVRRLAKARP